MTFYILGIIIPTDSYFFRGSTTNQLCEVQTLSRLLLEKRDTWTHFFACVLWLGQLGELEHCDARCRCMRKHEFPKLETRKKPLSFWKKWPTSHFSRVIYVVIRLYFPWSPHQFPPDAVPWPSPCRAVPVPRRSAACCGRSAPWRRRRCDSSSGCWIHWRCVEAAICDIRRRERSDADIVHGG